jgi:hypothetical protein
VKLARIPDQATLTRLYYELGQLGARTLGHKTDWEYGSPSAEDLVTLASQASRYDPRLLWVLVEFLARDSGALNPVRLRSAARESRWPAALGVAFEFSRRVSHSSELEDLYKFTMGGIPRASGEQFFVSTHAFAGNLARREAEESLSQYKRWGYLSREEPFAKELGSTAHGTLGRSERLNLLRRLVERLGSISLSDYAEALGQKASPRQASRDLATAPFLTRRGKTRAARYLLRETRAPDQPLRVGQEVQFRVAGRRLRGVVLEDRGRAGRSAHQLVKVRVQDTLNPSDRYDVEVPAEWATPHQT